MAGPAPQERKHGRTPTSSADWREYEDVPFAGAPPMPKPPGRRKSWHPMVEAWWATTSTMPHCVDWRPEDWTAVFELMYEKERYYSAKDDDKTTAQLTEIRRREAALGIGDQARIQLRIRYKQKVEPGLSGGGPDGAQEVVDDRTRPAGNVLSIKDRRASITSRAPGGGQAETATG